MKQDCTKADLVSAAEQRRSRRRAVNRIAKIVLAPDWPPERTVDVTPRDCLVTDLSTGGVRLHVEGFSVPDEFVLLHRIAGGLEGFRYRVVWREEDEIGASFVGRVGPG
jgi:hypothetical protein